MSVEKVSQTQMPVAAPAQVSPLTHLSGMLNAKGEIDLESLDFGTRIQKFQEFEQKSNCNIVLLGENIFAQFPPGTSLIPIPVIPKAQDAWRGEDAKKMQLKPGMVEPSADFIIQLGNLLGVKTHKVFEGVDDSTGVPMYSIKYNAYLVLPDGSHLCEPDEGKNQALYTGQGTIQAHIVESTRKKAKRNAIKAVLRIRTQMPQEEFDRPWVLMRPVFRAGVSAETDAIIAEQKKIHQLTTAQLYGPQAVDNSIDVGRLKSAIESAETMDELITASKPLRGARLTRDERDELSLAYATRKKTLETGEVPAAQAVVNVAPAQEAPPAFPHDTQQPGGGF